jgi:DNA (cytosine-5)-methyltransferase 1
MGKRLKIGSLCTGYGGLDLAAEAYFGAETIWCAEMDKYASQVIEQRFNIPNYGNIKEIDWASLEPIDILTAGYPCQPFSHAGYRKGTDDERHIFPYILEAISILKPRWVILENVRGHLSLGLKEVLAGLASIGYDAKWQVVRASDVGAPHQRARIFIIAYPDSKSRGISFQNETIAYSNDIGQNRWINSRYEEAQPRIEGNKISISNSIGKFKSSDKTMQEVGRKFTARCDMPLQDIPNALDQDEKLNAYFVEYMMGLPKGWVTETGLSRAQQLKMLGNGVVPQQAELALELLLTRHAQD